MGPFFEEPAISGQAHLLDRSDFVRMPSRTTAIRDSRCGHPRKRRACACRIGGDAYCWTIASSASPSVSLPSRKRQAEYLKRGPRQRRKNSAASAWCCRLAASVSNAIALSHRPGARSHSRRAAPICADRRGTPIQGDLYCAIVCCYSPRALEHRFPQRPQVRRPSDPVRFTDDTRLFVDSRFGTN